MATSTSQPPAGILSRLRGLVFGQSPPARGKSRTPASEVVAEAQAAVCIEDYAEVLGIEVTEPEPLTPEEAIHVNGLAEQVLAKLGAQDAPAVAMPTASLKVINMVATGNPDVGELSRLVSSDAAITAAVLRVANSAANASLGEQTTVRNVIARLGTKEVGRVAGAVAAHALFNPKAKAEQAVFGKRWKALHHDAATCAAGAAYLSMELNRGKSDVAYLGGMMHDIGKPLALGALARLKLDGEISELPSEAVIDALLEKVHVTVGGDVHVAWSLPDYLTELCACHQDENLPATAPFAETHLVRTIAGLLALRHEPGPLHSSDALLQSVTSLGIKPRQLRAIDTELNKLADKVDEAICT